ncbi:hypothetical protein, partial [Halomonas marinisediminis]|uniref:hypothetical protein n=1 Tax=Halomonas marinisediminis TaxID=2546095 RepID=UPI00197B0360
VFFDTFRKTHCRTVTSATFTACNVCPSPAADAYFTALPADLQALPVKSLIHQDSAWNLRA